ncbi:MULTISPECIES: S1 RNA-binding domain-containing protein [Thermaerobacter]|uniref:S1 RNA-binding domain-containing protein n=1 Tax=Thermaerobacter composti TaxID=554949 RepID=A0ABZ0QM65_9FIRM|nr:MULTISPECIES: S1 RNA-binding domain-containing protein [Thermaerobacter]PZN07158.1 MAG: RNA-binding protein S1 [Bacillota bacterium]QBS38103.1 S1 RNA-binding domain-containing protein [Thermaerobacter sp. FW80]WPD18128.1 S1 RNA-binding domain-containing protein [Thermaerobacter composti]
MAEAYTVGDIVEGTVDGITGFGAFVKLPDGRTGLVHISEVAHGWVENVSDHLSVGDTVKVKILRIDEANNKIALSIKATQPAPPDGGRRPRRDNRDFERKLADFLKQSEKKLRDARLERW